MSGFNGKWRFVNHSNLEAYHNQIKSPEAYKEKLFEIVKSSKTNPDAYAEDFKVDLPGNTVYRTAYVNGVKVREASIPIGVTTDVNGPDGRKYKGTVTFDGDTKLQLHQKGTDFEATLIYELKGDKIELSLTSGSVTANESYDRV